MRSRWCRGAGGDGLHLNVCRIFWSGTDPVLVHLDASEMARLVTQDGRCDRGFQGWPAPPFALAAPITVEFRRLPRISFRTVSSDSPGMLSKWTKRWL